MKNRKQITESISAQIAKGLKKFNEQMIQQIQRQQQAKTDGLNQICFALSNQAIAIEVLRKEEENPFVKRKTK